VAPLVTLKIMDLVDLIIDKDRHMTITTPTLLGGMGISKITILKTEGFIHKKAGHKVLPWIETRCQEGMETDHHLPDPHTQEETGAGQTTLTLRTQGSAHKRIRRTPILLRETLGQEEKIVCLDLLHSYTHNLKIV
jgi:hypothetical protein